ncbi:hypothetical protein GCM10008174_25740 [Methylopila turkensis]|uniref:DUF2497 domain-containing protein n=2 Tax=Methylopila turkensis TaxID=1437816 RepID=A0A9W6N7S6_9HYPH|nr:hypothetical protein GCM10008174_25740 [Methylopila turkensis]
MEEILASIRRIISDDEPTAAAKEPVPLKPLEKPAAEAPASLGQDDIDAMLASFDEPEPAPAKEALAAPPPVAKTRQAEAPLGGQRGAKIEFEHDVDVFELTDAMVAEPAEPEPEPAPRPAARAQPREPEPAAAFADRLVSPSTDETVGAAFGSLANTILATNGRTIDDLVKEMLRPMLRAWLDDNLPPLVERLVRQEIERVARGR